MLSWGVHLAHTGSWGIGLLQRLEDRIRGDVGLLPVLGIVSTVLDRFSPPWLVLVVGVVFLVLHPQALSLLHKRTLLTFIEQSGNNCTGIKMC